MTHLGIDLGTAFSLVSFVNNDGVPTLCPDIDRARSFQTASAVHVGPRGILVGQALEDALETLPDLPIVRFAKLSMGSRQPVFTDHQKRDWDAEAISALVLKKLRRDAEGFVNSPPQSLVLTVPAQFGDRERRSTMQAALMAELPVPYLVDEPVAAATYYGLDERGGERTIFVYDLGGGTFDATLLHASSDGLYVLSTAGSNSLGGKWIDDKLVEILCDECLLGQGLDPLRQSGGSLNLRRTAENIKITLSNEQVPRVHRTLIFGSMTQDIAIGRPQFDRIITPMLDETIAISERCLADAALSWGAVDMVVLTGGTSQLPAVRQRLMQVSGKVASQIECRQPFAAVAHGAALIAQARARGGDGADLLQQQIASNDLGISIWDDRTNQMGMKVLIPRNTPLPAKHTDVLFTRRDDQTRIVIELVQRKSESSQGASLGHFAFGPIAAPRKNYPLEITVTYEREGFVQVVAKDPRTGQQMNAVLNEEAGTANTSEALLRDVITKARINE